MIIIYIFFFSTIYSTSWYIIYYELLKYFEYNYQVIICNLMIFSNDKNRFDLKYNCIQNKTTKYYK